MSYNLRRNYDPSSVTDDAVLRILKYFVSDNILFVNFLKVQMFPNLEVHQSRLARCGMMFTD